MDDAKDLLLNFDANKFVAALRTCFDANPKEFLISSEYLAQCTGAQGEVLPDRFDSIALVLACGYHDHQLSFPFCDAVVNILIANVVSDAVAQRNNWPAAYSTETGHPNRGKPDTQSSANWTGIPRQTGHFGRNDAGSKLGFYS